MKIRRSKTIYVCDYCGQSHSTPKKAEACESACKSIKEKQLQEKAEREKLEKDFFNSESVSVIAEKLSNYLTEQSKKECRVVFKVRPNEHCSNSHSAPKGKSSNWCGRYGDKPVAYLGLVGELSIHIQGGYNSEVSRAWDSIARKFCIHTGSGGSSAIGLAWSVTLWADDFPKIKEKLEEYFKLVKNNQMWERDCEEINFAYQAAKCEFVEGHPTYFKKKMAVIDAQKALADEAIKCTSLFFDTHDKPKSLFEEVTKQDVDDQWAAIL